MLSVECKDVIVALILHCNTRVEGETKYKRCEGPKLELKKTLSELGLVQTIIRLFQKEGNLK
jgi:hypothetical protein